MHKSNFSGSFVHRVPSKTCGDSSRKNQDSSLVILVIINVRKINIKPLVYKKENKMGLFRKYVEPSRSTCPKIVCYHIASIAFRGMIVLPGCSCGCYKFLSEDIYILRKSIMHLYRRLSPRQYFPPYAGLGLSQLRI